MKHPRFCPFCGEQAVVEGREVPAISRVKHAVFEYRAAQVECFCHECNETFYVEKN